MMNKEIFLSLLFSLLSMFYWYAALEYCKEWPKLFGFSNGDSHLHVIGVYGETIYASGDGWDQTFFLNKGGSPYLVSFALSEFKINWAKLYTSIGFDIYG
jgi:hypothetical protein